MEKVVRDPRAAEEQTETEEEEEGLENVMPPVRMPVTNRNAGSEVRPDTYTDSSQVTLAVVSDDIAEDTPIRWFMLPASTTAPLRGPLEVTGLSEGNTLSFRRTPATTGLYWIRYTDATTGQKVQEMWNVVVDLAYETATEAPVANTATYLPALTQAELADQRANDTDYGQQRYGQPGLYVRTDGTAHVHVRDDPPRAETRTGADAAPAASLRLQSDEIEAWLADDDDDDDQADAQTHLVWLRGDAFDLKNQFVASSADGEIAWTPDPSGGVHTLWVVQTLAVDLDLNHLEVPLVRRKRLRAVQVPPQAAGAAHLDSRTVVLDAGQTGTLWLPAADPATGLALPWMRNTLDERLRAPVPVPPSMIGVRQAADDADTGVYRAAVPDLRQLPVDDPLLRAALRSPELGAPLTEEQATELDRTLDTFREEDQKLQTAIRSNELRDSDEIDMFIVVLLGISVTVHYKNAPIYQLQQLVRRRRLVHQGNLDKLTTYLKTLKETDYIQTQVSTQYPQLSNEEAEDGNDNDEVTPATRRLGEAVQGWRRARSRLIQRYLLAPFAPYYAGAYAFAHEPVPAYLAPQLGDLFARHWATAVRAEQWLEAPTLALLAVLLTDPNVPDDTRSWWHRLPGFRRPVPTRAYVRTVRPKGYDLRTMQHYDPVHPPAWGSIAWRYNADPRDGLVAQWWRDAQAQAGHEYPLWLRLWDGEQWAAERVAAGDRRVPDRTPAVFAEARRQFLAWWGTELAVQPGLAGRLPPGPVHTPARLDALYDGDAALDARTETSLHPAWQAHPSMSAAEGRAWRFLLAAPTRTTLQRVGARSYPVPEWPELEPGWAQTPGPGAHVRGYWLDGPSSTTLGPQQHRVLEQVLDEIAELRRTPSRQRVATVAAWLAGGRPLKRSAVFVRTDGSAAERERERRGALVRNGRLLPAGWDQQGPSPMFARGRSVVGPPVEGVLLDVQ